MRSFAVGVASVASLCLLQMDVRPANAANTTDYQVKIYTQNANNAGTDSDCYIQLLGTQGASVDYRIETPVKQRYKGKLDTFNVRTSDPIGTVYSVRLTLRGKKSGDDWGIGWVSVSKGNEPAVLHYSETWNVRIGPKHGAWEYTKVRAAGPPKGGVFTPLKYPKHAKFVTLESCTLAPPGKKIVKKTTIEEGDEINLFDSAEKSEDKRVTLKTNFELSAGTPSVRAKLGLSAEKATQLLTSSKSSADVKYTRNSTRSEDTEYVVPEDTYCIETVKVYEIVAEGSQTYGDRKIIIQKSPTRIYVTTYQDYPYGKKNARINLAVAKGLKRKIETLNKKLPEDRHLEVPAAITALIESEEGDKEKDSNENSCDEGEAPADGNLVLEKTEFVPGDEIKLRFKTDKRCDDSAFIQIVEGDDDEDDEDEEKKERKALRAEELDGGADGLEPEWVGTQPDGEVELLAPEEPGVYYIHMFSGEEGESIHSIKIEVSYADEDTDEDDDGEGMDLDAPAVSDDEKE